MTTMSVTEFSKNLRSVFDRIEHGGEEIILIRNNHRIARIIPGAPSQTALQAMSDLYATLPEDAAKDWEEEGRVAEKLEEGMINPWDS